ncbi:MAG TPA: outer membrane beta-barrel protein, partial [Thermoguttaceae bacterium]|nr:outer membrane beta-barrel protein [Thermoguttaceae bacterium]
MFVNKALSLGAMLAICAGTAALAQDGTIAGSCCEPTCCDAAVSASCDACCQCGASDPWTLFGTSCNGLTVGGWASAGLYSNAHGAADNGPLGFNNVGDGATFNELWIFAEKVADTGGCGTDWGFRIDYVFGADGPDTQAFGGLGWDTQWNTARDYGSAMPQLYGEFAINDLTIKFGHFYTIIGWEVVPAPDNFFYSHAYTMYYAEPFTHTGFLATYQVSDRITAHGGWVQGWDTGFDNTPKTDMFLGGISVG